MIALFHVPLPLVYRQEMQIDHFFIASVSIYRLHSMINRFLTFALEQRKREKCFLFGSLRNHLIYFAGYR